MSPPDVFLQARHGKGGAGYYPYWVPKGDNAMELVKVLEMIDPARSEAEAARMLGYQATQPGFLAGRVLAPERGEHRRERKGWRAQTFHDAGSWDLGEGPEGDVVLAAQSLLDSCQIVLSAGHDGQNPVALCADA